MHSNITDRFNYRFLFEPDIASYGEFMRYFRNVIVYILSLNYNKA